MKVGLDDAIHARGGAGELLAASIAKLPLPDDRDTGRRPSQSARLLSLAAEAELFHTPDGQSYATIPVHGHRETWPLRSHGFRRWLMERLYRAEGSAAGAQAVQDALGVLDGRAVYDGPEHPVHVRIAEREGAIYLDLGTAGWEAVEVTPNGWRVVASPPVRFRRPRGLMALPHPVGGGTIAALRPFLNVDTEADFMLLVHWLVAALRPRGPYPALIIHGEQGSAKSTAARVLRTLVDPNTASLRAEPREGRDLVIAANNSWCLAFDNLSHLPPWLSDALCRLATGGGYATRLMYSDDEEAIFDVTRPVLLTGIEELATRGDLLDRSIIAYLPAIAEEQRQPEAAFWRTFEVEQPRILGALLDAVSRALRDVEFVHLSRLPRMADFALWSAAAAPALGWPRDRFFAAYENNREAAHDLTLEASAVAGPLRALIKAPWQGPATELLAWLNAEVDEAVRRQRGWPANPRTLSNMLRRLAPNLRAAGLAVELDHRRGRNRTRVISIHPVTAEQATIAASAASAAAATVAVDSDQDDAADASRAASSVLASARGGDSDSGADAADAADGEMQPYSLPVSGADPTVLLALARVHGYPRLPFDAGRAVAEGAERWQTFARNATVPDLQRATQLLEGMA